MPVVLVLPELLPLLAALGALLLAFVFRNAIARFLTAIFENIPVIGGQIVKAIQWAVDNADRGAKAVVDAAVQPLTDFVDAVVGSAMLVVSWVTAAATWLGVTLRIVIANLWNHIQALEADIGRAVSGAATALARIVAQAAALTALGARVAWVIATAIPSAIAQAVGKAVAQAQLLVRAAQSLLVAAINSALAVALRAVGNEAGARAAADAAVKAYAAAAVAVLGQQTGAQLGQLGQAIDATEIKLGQAIDQVTARIGPLAFPTVAAAIATITATITTLERECVSPTCNYLGPQLDALNLAMDGAMLLAVMELVASAANDPEGAARETIAVQAPLVGMVSGLFADFTGRGVRV